MTVWYRNSVSGVPTWPKSVFGTGERALVYQHDRKVCFVHEKGLLAYKRGRGRCFRGMPMAVTELAEVTGCDGERSLRWAIRQARFGRFGDRGCGSAADVNHELAGEVGVGEPLGDGPGGD